jgi:hypothetical protein
VAIPPRPPGPREPVIYCLTRDREFATAVDERLDGASAYYFNDAARLHQAVMLRAPDVVVIDTGAIRPEFGDAGLGPVVTFIRERAAGARIAVRPAADADRLVGAEAGVGALMLPAAGPACAEVVATLSRVPRP